ncbi:MAG: hypothetical protein ACI92I_000450 [Acidimicrobiales bacterium]|jgi:hypothetical protein
MFSFIKIATYLVALELIIILSLVVADTLTVFETQLFVGCIAFITSIFLMLLWLYSLLLTPSRHTDQYRLVFMPIISLVGVTLTSVIYTGLFTTQLFGFSFELTAGASIFIFGVHLIAAYYFFSDRKEFVYILIHAFGIYVLLYTTLIFFTKTEGFGSAEYIAIAMYAFILSSQIDSSRFNAKYIFLQWSLYLYSLGILVYTFPTLITLVILCFFYITTLIPRFFTDKEQSHFKSYATLLLGCTLLFSLTAGSTLHKNRISETNDEVVSIQSVPGLINRTILREPNFWQSIFGFGPNSTVKIWLNNKPFEIATQTATFDDPLYIGSYAFTHMINTGFLGIIAWILFFLALCMRAVGVCKSLFNKSHKGLYPHSFFVVIVGALYILFLTTPTYSTLLWMGLLLGVSLFERKNIEPVKDRLKVFTVPSMILITILALLVLKHALSISTSIYYYQKAILSVPKENYISTLWDFKIAHDARLHPVILRSHSQYTQQILRKTLEKESASGSEIENLLKQSVSLATQAVKLDGGDYRNWLTLGNAYFILSQFDVDGSYERAHIAYNSAREHARRKTEIDYMQAQLALLKRDFPLAQIYIDRILNMVPNDSKVIEMQQYLIEEQGISQE